MKEVKPKAEAFIAEISRELEQAQREAELTSFEIDEPRPGESVSSRHLETILSRAKRMSVLATSLTSVSASQEWQQMPPEAQRAESELRKVVARRVESATNRDSAEDADASFSIAFARWTEMTKRLSLDGSRIELVSQLAAEAQHLG
jgi:hypothetical protein